MPLVPCTRAGWTVSCIGRSSQVYPPVRDGDRQRYGTHGFAARGVNIYSPMVTGSGAYIVHQQLAQGIADYRLQGMPPRRTVFPPLLRRYRCADAIVHTAPDFGPSVLSPENKVVLTFHNYYLDREALRYASFSQRLFYRTVLSHAIKGACKRADAVTAVSDFTASLVKHHLGYAGEVVVIKNGVDERKFFVRSEPHQGRECRVLFAGNLTRRKGAQLLQYIGSGLPAGCHLAYTSGLRRAMSGHANDKLVQLGRIPHAEMPGIYRGADVLFFPTLREGLGLAAVEAMACGLPVVTTRCSALPEVVEHGKGGYLCEINDGPEMLKRLRQLIDDPHLRQEMGEYNREKVLRDFRLQRMIEDYESLFSALEPNS